MRRLSKDFEVDYCEIYKYRNKCYTEVPNGLYIAYYLYDEITDIYTGVLRKKRHITLWLLLALYVVCGMLWVNHSRTLHSVNISKTIYCKKNLVGLNIVNEESNKDEIYVQLVYKDKLLTKFYKLPPGEALGNMPMQQKLKRGSYMCTLKYVIPRKWLMRTWEYEVLLVVE